MRLRQTPGHVHDRRGLWTETYEAILTHHRRSEIQPCGCLGAHVIKTSRVSMCFCKDSPFIHCLLLFCGYGRGQQVKENTQISFSPVTLSSSSYRNPKNSSPASSGSALRSTSSGMCSKRQCSSEGRSPGGILIRCPNSLSCFI